MEFTDKVVLITGGSKGIGREAAKLFASKGAIVIITGRREDALQMTSDLINEQFGRCEYHQGDVTSITDCERIVADVYNRHKRIDVLINNAGMSMRGLFEETALALFHKVIAINFSGAVNMTKFALPYLKEHQGSVVFVSSLSGLKGIPGIAPYGTAKMALTGFSESLRAEVHQYHVHVGLVFVGFTQNDDDKTIYSATGERLPIHRAKNDATQEGVSRSILRCVHRRKAVMYLTVLGKVSKLLYQFFPRFSSYLLRKFTMNSEMMQT